MYFTREAWGSEGCECRPMSARNVARTIIAEADSKVVRGPFDMLLRQKEAVIRDQVDLPWSVVLTPEHVIEGRGWFVQTEEPGAHVVLVAGGRLWLPGTINEIQTRVGRDLPVEIDADVSDALREWIEAGMPDV